MLGVLSIVLSWLLCLRRRGASCQVLGSRGRPREAEVRLLPCGWVLTKLCGRSHDTRPRGLVRIRVSMSVPCYPLAA
jgi:hypothetical protein